MSKVNHMKDVCKLLDVEYDKEFMLKGWDNTKFLIMYGGLYCADDGVWKPELLTHLLLGNEKIIK